MIDGYDSNIASLIFGLIAWLLPLLAYLFKKYVHTLLWTVMSLLSFLFCSLALYYQLVANRYLVEIEDWTALMDTAAGVVVVSRVLIIGTILLNIISFVGYYKKINKKDHS